MHFYHFRVMAAFAMALVLGTCVGSDSSEEFAVSDEEAATSIIMPEMLRDTLEGLFMDDLPDVERKEWATKFELMKIRRQQRRASDPSTQTTDLCFSRQTMKKGFPCPNTQDTANDLWKWLLNRFWDAEKIKRAREIAETRARIADVQYTNSRREDSFFEPLQICPEEYQPKREKYERENEVLMPYMELPEVYEQINKALKQMAGIQQLNPECQKASIIKSLIRRRSVNLDTVPDMPEADLAIREKWRSGVEDFIGKSKALVAEGAHMLRMEDVSGLQKRMEDLMLQLGVREDKHYKIQDFLDEHLDEETLYHRIKSSLESDRKDDEHITVKQEPEESVDKFRYEECELVEAKFGKMWYPALVVTGYMYRGNKVYYIKWYDGTATSRQAEDEIRDYDTTLPFNEYLSENNVKSRYAYYVFSEGFSFDGEEGWREKAKEAIKAFNEQRRYREALRQASVPRLKRAFEAEKKAAQKKEESDGNRYDRYCD